MGNDTPKFEIGDCIGPAGKGKVVMYNGLFFDKKELPDGRIEARCMYASNYGDRGKPPECGNCMLSNGSVKGVVANVHLPLR